MVLWLHFKGRCEPQGTNPEFTLSILPSWRNISNDVVQVYTSGHLSDGPSANGTYYNYDACGNQHSIGCYSAPVQAEAKYINLLHPQGKDLTLQFGFKNNARNMQLACKEGTGWVLTLHYAAKPQKEATAAGGTAFIALTLGGLATYFLIGAVGAPRGPLHGGSLHAGRFTGRVADLFYTDVRSILTVLLSF